MAGIFGKHLKAIITITTQQHKVQCNKPLEIIDKFIDSTSRTEYSAVLAKF